MTSLEGAVLDGLDEFMLRIGHLKVICSVASEFGGGLHRTQREVSQRLMEEVELNLSEHQEIGEYLVRKRLCRVTANGNSTEPTDGGRYPDLSVVEESGKYLVRSDEGNPKVWWQDYCLSKPGIPSRVGAVTTKAKSGSKTGLSHVIDWATMVGLFSRSGDPTPDAELVAFLTGPIAPDPSHNPYLIGFEKLILGYWILFADFDVFSRLLPRLYRNQEPVNKKTAIQIFIDTVAQVVAEAESDRQLGNRRAFSIFQLGKELPREGGRNKSLSTLWHRVASRLETYVDLGLLHKPEAKKYEYYYELVDAHWQTVASLERCATRVEWLGEHLADSLFGGTTRKGHADMALVEEALPIVQKATGRAGVPIPILTLAFAILSLRRTEVVSLQQAVSLIHDFAVASPQRARLSRGDTGFGADFISFRKE